MGTCWERASDPTSTSRSYVGEGAGGRLGPRRNAGSALEMQGSLWTVFSNTLSGQLVTSNLETVCLQFQ